MEPRYAKWQKVRVQFTVPIAFTLNGDDITIKSDNVHKNTNDNLVTIGAGKVYTDTTKKPVGVVLTEMTNGMNEPLYIIDGKEVKPDVLKKINAQDILSIAILKDAAATSLYGKKAINGVVEITMKKK